MCDIFNLVTLVKMIVSWLILLLLLQFALAQVMTSSNYQIQSDSVNGGGGYSTSSGYRLESTVGEVATGESTSTSYRLRAGYQQMHEVYLALSGVASVVMAPSLPGLTGGTATGSTAVHVVTDSQAGYQLTILADRAPAMQSGISTIADYVPVAGSVPDFNFITSASDAHFGFSPEGVDITTRFQNNASVCGVTGGDAIDRCWDGLSTTSAIIAGGTGSNNPAGATTTVKFRVGIGGGIAVPEGSYEATMTLTAVAL